MSTLSKIKNGLLISLSTLVVGYIGYKRITREPKVDLTEYIKIGSKEYIKLSTQRDTVYKDTIIYSEKYIPKVVYKTKTKNVLVPAEVDTTEILKDYYAKRFYVDVITDGTEDGNSVVVKDTISENKIISRKTEFNVKTKIVTETVVALQKPRTQIFIGPGFDYGALATGANASILIKNKKDKIYKLQAGVQNIPGQNDLTPYYGVGVYWKIRLGKK